MKIWLIFMILYDKYFWNFSTTTKNDSKALCFDSPDSRTIEPGVTSNAFRTWQNIFLAFQQGFFLQNPSFLKVVKASQGCVW